MKNNIKTPKIKGLRWGRVEFKGLGGYPEEMLTEILESGVAVRNIRFGNGEISGAVSPSDYYELSETARRNGVRLRAGKRRGLYFTFARYQTRVGLAAGFLGFLLFIALWQTSVQAVSIEGGVPKTQITQILEECGIKLGASVDSLQMSKAEHRIMAEIEDCAWVDVSCEGFRVNVKVETGVPKPEMEDDAPRNIVAARPATIVRQIPRTGASAVSNGSGVNTGDLLVSGTVFDGRDHILFVRADAEIIGEWTETKEFFVPYSETVSVADGEQKSYKYLVCNDDVYPLFRGKAGMENALYTEETSVVKFFGEDTAFKIKTGVYTAYTEHDITRSPDDVLSELQKRREDYEENFYGEYEIINAEQRFYPQDDGIRLTIDYTIQGDIAKPAPIEMGEMSTPEPETSETSKTSGASEDRQDN